MNPNDKIIDTVERRIGGDGLLPDGSRVLVACSGGPDSTALLALLRDLSAAHCWELGVVHVDHGQGPGSTLVARKVQQRCRRWKLPFFLHALDPARFPPGTGETALREGRYAAFEAALDASGYDRLAIGHTASDQAETVLMRILRGTTTTGLTGIPAERSGRFVRPLLDLRRQQVEAFLRSRRLSWVEDPANRDPAFLRARVRNSLMPLLREQINPAVDDALLRLATAAQRDEEALRALTPRLDRTKPRPGKICVDHTQIAALLPAQQVRIVLDLLRSLRGDAGSNLEHKHLLRLLAKFGDPAAGPRWSMDLAAGVRAGRRDLYFFLDLGRQAADALQLEIPAPGTYRSPDRQLWVRIARESGFDPLPTDPWTAFFDADLVRFPLQLRSVRPGDRLRPWGGGGSKKVARLLLDEKVPREVRTRVPLLVMGDLVLWVAGIRRSDAAPVKSADKAVLRVEVRLTAQESDPILF